MGSSLFLALVDSLTSAKNRLDPFINKRIFALSQLEIIGFSAVLVLLIFLSGFFSAAETSLMAINRYRLRHKAKMKRRYAIIILRLLKRPDRLLGLILIGNNFSNILASALATLLAVHFWGDRAALLISAVLAFVILIFAEVAPKTLAALYPEKVAKIIAWPTSMLLKLLYPLVWLTNAVSNTLLRILGVKVTGQVLEPLSREELRTIVYETSGRLSRDYQNMLLGILDLNRVTVKDIMIPKNEIIGIDIEWSWNVIRKQIATSEYDWLPVYRENINHVLGLLHMRDLMRLSLNESDYNNETLLKLLHESYFVPEGTSLNIQLLNFQRTRKRMALVVDEYGEILGLVTVVDILEEIVGEFTTSVTSVSKLVQAQPDGSYLVDGAITLRELYRQTHWQLPSKTARTLNGLIIEYLESMPQEGTCLKIAGFPIEILNVYDNRVKVARIFPSRD